MQTDMKAMTGEFMDMQLKRMEAMGQKYTPRITEMEDKCTKQTEQMNSSLMDITLQNHTEDVSNSWRTSCKYVVRTSPVPSELMRGV